MDIDKLKETIQDFFQDNTLTIVGSGLSAAEGIPGMDALADKLRSDMPPLLTGKDDIDIWNKIVKDLDDKVGLEKALQNSTVSQHIEKNIRRITAKLIGDAETKILTEVYYRNRTLKFSEYINRFNVNNSSFTVVTTNYDRLIECACELNGIEVNNLFEGAFFAQLTPEQGRYAVRRNATKRSKEILVLKPHGCLSWYMKDGQPICVKIGLLPVDDCLIITPGTNKYEEGYSLPFERHRNKANEEIDRASRFIIIGYGFNDHHLENHLRQQLKAGKPALILAMTLSDNAREVARTCSNVIAIEQGDTNGSTIITKSEEFNFDSINLWDIEEMIKEVF